MDIAKLFELQKLDVNLEKARRKLVQLKEALGESDELKSSRATVSATEAQLQQWRSAQKDAELEAQSLSEQIDQKSKDLMSGRVRDPKELEAMQNNVESLRRHRTSVEDTGMDALMHVESLTTQLGTEQSVLQQVEEKWKAGQSDVLQEEARYKRAYVQYKQQREALAQSLQPADLKFYEDLRTRKQGIALSPLQNGQCGVCHIQVPVGVASSVRSRKNEAVYCPSCGRVLYGG